MVTGSGRPLVSKAQSYNMELVSAPFPQRLSTAVDPHTALQRPHRVHSFSGITLTAPVAPTEGSAEGKSFERVGNIQISQI